MSGSSISDEADPLYQPLAGPEAWAAVNVDEEAWAGAVDTLGRFAAEDPDWAAMVARGALLAAAYQSGAGVATADRAVELALLRGEAAPASVLPYVQANYGALLLARHSEVSEDAIRRLHEVACHPQTTHRVLVEGRVQDHVLALGDYKHHPNHVLTDAGAWLPTAPVARLDAELAALVEAAASPGFAALHPVVQAAYLHHALLHVQPFADGNGRVARALAGGRLLRAGGPPLVVDADDVISYFDDRTPAGTVGVVQRAVAGLASTLAAADHDGPAVERWRRREVAAHALRARLADGIPGALKRHAEGGGRRADLSAVTVAGDEPLVVREPMTDVDEVLTVDAHPLDDGPPSITAREAGLRLVAGGALDPWLDRVMSILALRVAAAVE